MAANDLTGAEAITLAELIAQAGATGARSELLPATLNVEASIRNRVFTLGQKADGTSIGQYSTEPMYLHLPTARAIYGATLPLSGLQARGKAAPGKKRPPTAPITRINDAGEREFVERSSRYYPGGYAEFRRDVGRQTDHVDLMLSGEMAGAIQTGLSGDDAIISFTNDEAREKADANEIRFGGVAGNDDPVIVVANRSDVDELLDALTRGAHRAVDKLFGQ